MIKGISDVRRLPRLGKIRLGIMEKSARTGNEFPRATDYFVVNADKSTTEAAAAAFHKVYGDKPRALDIMFPTEDVSQFFPQWYRRYGSGTGLLCKGDGEIATLVDKEAGEMSEIACLGPDCEWAQKKHCRPVGSLQFLLPEVPGLGAWQIDTSSFHSIVNVNSGIEFIRKLTGGRIAGLPLKLTIRPKEVTADGKKKTVWVLDLAAENVKIADLLQNAQKTMVELLLPPVDMDVAPDDLYPKSLIGDQGDDIKEAEVVDEAAAAADDALRKAINDCWDKLGVLPAKRNAILARPGLDKQALLKQLQAEVAKRTAASGHGAPAAPAASGQPAGTGMATSGQPAGTAPAPRGRTRQQAAAPVPAAAPASAETQSELPLGATTAAPAGTGPAVQQKAFF